MKEKGRRSSFILVGGLLGAFWGFASIFLDIFIAFLFWVLGLSTLGEVLRAPYLIVRWTIFLPAMIVDTAITWLIYSPFCPPDEMVCSLGLLAFPLSAFVGMILGVGAAFFIGRRLKWVWPKREKK